MTRYQRYRAEGRCGKCGLKLKPRDKGHATCKFCRWYHRGPQKEYGRQRRAELRHCGLCIRCGQNPVESERSRNFCLECLTTINTRRQSRKKNLQLV